MPRSHLYIPGTSTGGGGGGGGDIKSDGSVPFAANESMGGFKLTNVADPTLAQDAATKAYVDAATGVSTPLEQIRYVAKNGNDGTADGSIQKPFLTIQAAINSILDATNLKRYVILVMPGTYVEALTFPPNIGVVGQMPSQFPGNPRATIINGVVSLSAAWAGPGLFNIYFANIWFQQGLTFDFSTSTGVDSNDGTAALYNCFVNSTIDIKSKTINNLFFMQDCQVHDLYQQIGMNATIINTRFTFGANSIGIGAPAVDPGNVAVLRLVGGSWDGTFSTGATAAGLQLRLHSFTPGSAATFNVTSGSPLFQATVDSFPPTANFTPGAATIVHLNDAPGLGYTPTIPANWSPAPVQVGEALDQLAARVSTTLTFFHTVTAPEAAAKSFSLGSAPAVPNDVLVDIKNGFCAQQNGVDFDIVGVNFNWTGFALDGVLVAGNVVRFQYKT